MARDDDESTPRRPMTKCEVLAWFFGKSRFDARPDRCAKCPAQMRSSTQEEKNLYENMLARMSTPIDVDIFAYDDVTAHAAECARRCCSDGEGD